MKAHRKVGFFDAEKEARRNNGGPPEKYITHFLFDCKCRMFEGEALTYVGAEIYVPSTGLWSGLMLSAGSRPPNYGRPDGGSSMKVGSLTGGRNFGIAGGKSATGYQLELFLR